MANRFLRLALLSLALITAASRGQLPADQAAKMLLDTARRAYNDKQYPFAVTKFREFIQKYGGHRDAPSARYGLGLSLLEGNDRNYQQAGDELAAIAANKAMPEHPFVLYYLGLARRGQGVQAMSQALAKPAEANAHRETARQRFEDAAKQFGSAAPVFIERGKDAKADKELPPELEWAMRSRCDQAEMLLRIKKPKEAREALSLLTGADAKKWLTSKYATLGLYYSGLAAFQLGDHFAAGKALSREAVLTDETFGTHARYVLARVHHQNTKQDEREDARTQYQAVLSGYEASKKLAQDRLRQPVDPETRGRLERLLKSPPDHVARAMFYLGVMQYEDNRPGEALEQFKNFVKVNPEGPLAAEATLHLGFCQVLTRQFDDALKTLQPIADKQPPLADQAFFWIGKAHAGKVDPAKGGKYDTALATLGTAADRAAALPGDAAKARRGEVLLERARLFQTAGRYREAIDTYQTVLSSNLLPARTPELTLERATAQQLNGEYAESDKTCQSFLEKFKDNTLVPAVLFRRAENSVFLAQALRKNPAPPEQAKAKAALQEAVKRYAALVQDYPESNYVNVARQGLGTAHYQLGDLDAARKAYESIPATERSGDLLTVLYQLADVHLRQMPARADDAVAAGRLEEKLKAAAELLDTFVGGAGEAAPLVPDALLKLGFVRQRQASLVANPAEQQKAYAEARAVYDRIQQKYPTHAAYPQATFERAKVLVRLNDPNGATNELRRFTADPLRKAPIAPMALVSLATLQRAQKKPADAAATLAECRKAHEAALNADATRKDWVPLIRYHQAAALREAGKLDDARKEFDEVTRLAPLRPEGWDAVLRAGQSQKEQGEKRIAEGRKQLQNPALKVEQKSAAEKLISDGTNDLRAAVQYLATQEAGLKTRKVEGDDAQKTLTTTRSRIQYEVAWGWRALADMEIESARQKLRQDRWSKRRDDLSKGLPPGSPPPQVAVPDVALSEVPVQPAETQARQAYEALIKAFPELAINADARLELSELLAARDGHAEAVKLLQGALEAEKEPSQELMDRIKVRLGACLLDQGSRKMLSAKRMIDDPTTKPDAKKKAEEALAAGRKDVEAGMEQIQSVSSNEKSKVFAQAVYREAECLLQLGKNEDAVKLLTRFRDNGAFHNLPGLSDRALLRLAYALGELKQWEPSRAAYQTVLDRFGGNGPWANEARYGVGWALQNLTRYDEAVNTYAQVTAAVTTELAARAQLNIGQCRLIQKRFAEAATALLVVPFTYDYPDLSALALVEAARALHETKQTNQAVILLKRVIRDYPGSAPADAARKRLTELGEA